MALLGDRDELLRRDQLPLTVPADQRFGTGDAAGAQINFGLQVKCEFIAGDGVTQQVYDDEPGLDPLLQIVAVRQQRHGIAGDRLTLRRCRVGHKSIQQHKIVPDLRIQPILAEVAAAQILRGEVLRNKAVIGFHRLHGGDELPRRQGVVVQQMTVQGGFLRQHPLHAAEVDQFAVGLLRCDQTVQRIVGERSPYGQNGESDPVGVAQRSLFEHNGVIILHTGCTQWANTAEIAVRPVRSRGKSTGCGPFLSPGRAPRRRP